MIDQIIGPDYEKDIIANGANAFQLAVRQGYGLFAEADRVRALLMVSSGFQLVYSIYTTAPERSSSIFETYKWFVK
jgi:hypothetical protein